MDTSIDYDVRTVVSFKLDFDGSGEMNLLALPVAQQTFAEHVRDIFKQDDTLRSYVHGDLTFRFNGRRGELEYTFSCHDDSEEEAESFSDYCVKSVRKDLEALGCRISRVRCTAEEADMTWLDQLEDAIFGTGEMEMK